MSKSYVGYIGVNAVGKDGGIRVVKADGDTGALELVQHVENFDAPCYFAIMRDRGIVVSARSNPDAPSTRRGMISTLRIGSSGTLEPIGSTPAACERPPCHTCVSPDGRFAYSAHYVEGQCSVYRIGDSGEPWGPIQVITHRGKGPHIQQVGPRVHYATFTPDGEYVCFVDLGLDVIHVCKPDENGVLSEVKDVPVVKGAGSRHMVFSNNGGYCWVLSEMNCLITAFAYNNGEFTQLETISSLDESLVKNKKSGSAIRVSPDGSMLLAGNRFVNTIGVFNINLDGSLTRTADIPCVFPRDLNFLPNGKFLYVCGQDVDCVETFSVDYEAKTLRPTGDIMNVPMPTCIDFLK